MLSLWVREFQEGMHLFELCVLALSAYLIYFMNIIITFNIVPSRKNKGYNYPERFSRS